MTQPTTLIITSCYSFTAGICCYAAASAAARWAKNRRRK